MMNANRFKKIFNLSTRFTAWIVALGAIVFLLEYSLDVSKRRSFGSVCQWDTAENPESFPYVARYCYLNKDTALLRLYDAKSEELVAERMYFEPDRVRIYWMPNKLLYSDLTDDTLSLPPSTLDRLRAKLP